MKRFISILTAITMLVSMFSIVAFASEEETSSIGATTTVAGGSFAGGAYADNITTTLASKEGEYTATTVDGVSMTVVPCLFNNTSGSKNMQFASYMSDSLNWKQTGCAEVTFRVSYSGELAAGDNIGFGIAFTAYSGSTRAWILSASTAWETFPFESGVTKDVRYIVEFTDSNTLVHRYLKDVDASNWTYVDTFTSSAVAAEGYRKIREIIPYGQQWIRSSSATASATMTNVTVREIFKTPELEAITRAYDTLNDDFADINYVLPENYDKAKLVIGGKTFKEFDSDAEDAGAYKTSVDLSEVPYAGALKVELIVTDSNGSVSTKTTTLNVSNPNDRELIASTDFDGNDEGSTLAYTAAHVKPNGKTGNGISVTNFAEYDADKFAPITGGNNAIQLNGVRDLKGYCYDIEFDMYQTSNASGTNGKSGVIVKNWYNNGTTNVTGWKTGGWNWIQDHSKVAGVSGKFITDTWHSMKYTINTVDSTLSAYDMDTGELLGSNSYVNDGVDYMGLGYAVYTGVETAVQVDNVKFYRYLPGKKTGIASVNVDQVSKTISITADTALNEENVTDANVTLTVGGNARTATVALAEDGKTILVTPNGTSTLSGKDALVTLAPAVIGSATTIPVSYVAEYSNRKIEVNEKTSAVKASVDIIADAAGEDAGIMYIAYYKNSNLTHVYKTNVTTTAAGLSTFTANYTPETRVDYDVVKVFIWDAYKNPLLKN